MVYRNNIVQNTIFIFLFLDNPVNVLPKPINNIKDTGPRRSLNLEDYKKKRGLI